MSRPSPPSPSASSTEIYGPQRHNLFSAAYSNLGRHVLKPLRSATAPNPVVTFDEAQLAMFAADNSARMSNIKDELATAAGKVTPGVDDGPYIQYALDALTRTPTSPQPHHSAETAESFMNQFIRRKKTPVSKTVPPPLVTKHATFADSPQIPSGMDSFAPPVAPAARGDIPIASPALSVPIGAAWSPKTPSSDNWVVVTEGKLAMLDPRSRTYPRLTYKPRILRPFSMMILMTLCLMMMAALIFCVKYSPEHAGLTAYPGTVYSGQYFVFRILPQLLAAIILIYAQSILNSSLRILPFVALAAEDPHGRYLALFQHLYPTTLLFPQWRGPWQIRFFDVATWLTLFTIPLHSAAFTCVWLNRSWVWAPTAAVVWTLVALYSILIVATATIMVFWFGKWTGLMWDIRSIADLLPLLNRSNILHSFDQRDLAEGEDEFQTQLYDRWFDRLGYWRSADSLTSSMWYTIGALGPQGNADSRRSTSLRRARTSEDRSLESEDLKPVLSWGSSHGRYLPWCFRNGPIIACTVIATMLVVALIVVAFIPQTAIEAGFKPLLKAKPGSMGFSTANFVYSFFPSLIGVIVFMLFQTVDQSLRCLQPWADLTQLDGSPAHKSILADYAACLPMQASLRAARNGHWRLAVISLMAQLFVFVPILGGGLFMALTAGDGQVRMYPSMPVLGVLIAFLVFYVGCLALMIPRRAQFELPRAVNSIAAMISMCSARDLVHDAAFRSVRSRADLKDRLGVGRADAREETTWFYGVVPGRDEHRVSVRRMQRYTEKRVIRPTTAMV